MTIYYKSYRYIDGKARWIITEENGEIINKNPTKEQLKNTIYSDRRKTAGRKCSKCGSSKTSKDTHGHEQWYKDKLEGKFLCKKCYDNKDITPEMYDYFVIKRRKFFEGRKCCRCGGEITYLNNPESPHWYNCICEKENCTGYVCRNCHYKQKRFCRIIGITKDSNLGKSIIDQAVCAKYFGIEDLNIKTDNFRYCVDLKNNEYGNIDVKGSRLIFKRKGFHEYDGWSFKIRRKLDCDTYILLGYSYDRKDIESVLVIPSEELYDCVGITIIRGSSSKYDKFKVDPKSYNDIYQSLMDHIKDKNHFTIEDIKKWSIT